MRSRLARSMAGPSPPTTQVIGTAAAKIASDNSTAPPRVAVSAATPVGAERLWIAPSAGPGDLAQRYRASANSSTATRGEVPLGISPPSRTGERKIGAD